MHLKNKNLSKAEEKKARQLTFDFTYTREAPMHSIIEFSRDSTQRHSQHHTNRPNHYSKIEIIPPDAPLREYVPPAPPPEERVPTEEEKRKALEEKNKQLISDIKKRLGDEKKYQAFREFSGE